MSGWLACVAALFLSLVGPGEGQARAAAFSVSLAYETGAGCPEAADFKAVVTARLGHDPFVDGAPDHVLVRIASRGRSLDGRIEWRDAGGRWAGDQTFSVATTDCARLVRAMGLALAVQIQLLARTGAAPDASVAAPAQTATPPDASPAPPAAKPPVAAPPSTGASAAPAVASASPPPAVGPGPVFAIGAGPSVGFGMSSTPVLLGRLFGALAWRHVSVELAAAASLPTTTRRADGAGFSQQHLLVSAAACAGVTRWNACLVANAGQVRMAGEDIDHPASARVPLVEAGARVGVIQHLGRRLFLLAHADGLIIVNRWTATLDAVPVWTAPRVAAEIGVAAGARFP